MNEAMKTSVLIKDTERLIRDTYWLLLVSSCEPLKHFGVTARQARILVALHRSEIETGMDISRILRSNSGVSTRLVDSLEARALITRNVSLSDRRVKTLKLTRAGFRLARQIIAGESLRTSLLGTQLSPQELSTLHLILKKVAAASTDLTRPP